MAYTIQIDEEQRAYIAECLRAQEKMRATITASKPDVDWSSLDYLLPMFDELPYVEDTHTVIHGLCL